MHREILSDNQRKLIPLIETFMKDFGLVGGTAIALHLGHRRSIDFDLFTNSHFDGSKIRSAIARAAQIQNTFVVNPDELTIAVENVKITFYTFPYNISYTENLDGDLRFPDLLTLAAMKAFALGQRAKWKDYVDLFFILKTCSIKDVSRKALALFGSEFNGRLFREQLSYHKDVDYSESVDYMEGLSVSDDEIKSTLSEISLQD